MVTSKRALLILLWACTLSSATWAQTSPKAAAEALFQAGRAHVERGEIADACKKFEASQSLDPALGTMLHLADCYERIGRTASAWAGFESAASVAQNERQSQRLHIARTRARALKPMLSRLELRVPAQRRAAGLVIRVSGIAIPPASWGVALPVDPGEQIIEASAPGRVDWKRTIQIVKGNASEVVEIPPLKDVLAKKSSRGALRPSLAPLSDDAPVERDGGMQRTIAITIGAVGIAGLVAGGVLGIRAILKNEESLDACAPEDATRCTSHGAALREDAEDFALASTVAFAIGGALLGTGIIVFATAPSESSDSAALRLRIASDGVSVGGAW